MRMEKGLAMRRPVLIAETPFANGHGPRFLAAPGRGVDAALAAHYIDRVRDEADDVEEVEGDDYLAVRMTLDDEATGEKAPQILILAGIDANKMTTEERDEVLEQLRERLEVLNDAVAAVDWTVHEHDFVLEIPELEEWHESGWDVLPRIGQWAGNSSDGSTTAFRGVDTEPPEEEKHEPESSTPAWEPPPEPEPEPGTRERIEDAGEPFRFGPTEEPDESTKRETVGLSPSPPASRGEGWGEGGLGARRDEFVSSPRQTPFTPNPSPPEAGGEGKNRTPKRAPPPPSPNVVAKATEPTATHAPAPAAITPASAPQKSTPPGKIDPLQVSESADRSASLAPLAPQPADAPRTRPMIFRWWVWGPWTAVAVLLTAEYFYLTQVDRTWDQRVTETHYVAGPTKVVQLAADKPAATPDSRESAWTSFVADFKDKLSRAELVPAADLLHGWSNQLATMTDPLRSELTELKSEFRKVAATRLQEWTGGRCRDRRFADAYERLTAFAASESVKAILNASITADAVSTARAQVRAAEDEYHYTQICTLAAAKPIPDEKLKQHIDAYLAIVDPPGRMLSEVQQIADYRKWIKDGRPAKAVVKVEWGKRTVAAEHKIEIGLGATPDGTPLKTFAASAVARPGNVWTETIAVSGIVGPVERIPYRVKATRPTSAIEELAEGVREHSELFGPQPATSAPSAPETGTVVTIDWKGLLDPPVLPAWKDSKAPVLPVSLPKVGP